jgi:hypothetical protein
VMCSGWCAVRKADTNMTVTDHVGSVILQFIHLPGFLGVAILILYLWLKLNTTSLKKVRTGSLRWIKIGFHQADLDSSRPYPSAQNTHNVVVAKSSDWNLPF